MFCGLTMTPISWRSQSYGLFDVGIAVAVVEDQRRKHSRIGAHDLERADPNIPYACGASGLSKYEFRLLP
jgi:hypothetical protein